MKSLFVLRIAIALVILYTLLDLTLGYSLEFKTNIWTLLDLLKGIKGHA